MQSTACGLDFGTSNSTLGYIGTNNAPKLAPLEGEKVAIPSAMFFNFEDDALYFGRAAISEYVTGADGRVMRALKSILGSSLINDETRVKARRISFTEILGTFIGELKKRSEAHLSHEIDTIVAGRPVRFVDDDDKADAEAQNQLKAALEGQGFKNIEFQFEPIAAALDFEQQLSAERLALVVDIGGGTSDFTLIRLSPEGARRSDRSSDILATAGVHIGGTDFDRLLSMHSVMPLLGAGSLVTTGDRPVPIGPYYDLATWHRINRLYTRQALTVLKATRAEAKEKDKLDKLMGVVEHRMGHLLATHVEEAKIALSGSDETPFRFGEADVMLERVIARSDFDNAVRETVGRVHTTITRILADAGVKADEVSDLVMTGGSTQIPILRNGLDRMFPAAQFVETDAFGSVGLGLALEAKRKFGG